jgi:tetraacyldisaccharide 4'-kinase
MKAPDFWNHRGVISTCLLPLSWLYTAAGWLRFRITTPQKLAVPVICIGNAVAGGAGKTPVAIAIAEILQQAGYAPSFISRGYGRKVKHSAPLRVLPAHDATETGDEPLLLARYAPCWVGEKRVDSARAALAEHLASGESKPQILVLDDGLQNPSLAKKLSLLVVDGAVGFGNQRVIPAGALREPLSAALSKAQALVIVGDNVAGITSPLPCFTGRFKPLTPLNSIPQPVLAFAGIGRPEKFFSFLREEGIKVAESIGFPDHHRYTEADWQRLQQQATRQGLRLVTTAKDAVKIPPAIREDITVIEVQFVWDNPQAIATWLQRELQIRRIDRS